MSLKLITLVVVVVCLSSCTAHTAACPAVPSGYARLPLTGGFSIDRKIKQYIVDSGHHAPGEMPLVISVRLKMRNSAEYDAFIQNQPARPLGSEPSAEWTRKMNEKFGRPDSDYAVTEEWLTSKGFVVKRVDLGLGLNICARGTVAQAQSAFATQILRSADDRWYTNTCDPAVPAHLAILAVIGLHNTARTGAGYPISIGCDQ